MAQFGEKLYMFLYSEIDISKSFCGMSEASQKMEQIDVKFNEQIQNNGPFSTLKYSQGSSRDTKAHMLHMS